MDNNKYNGFIKVVWDCNCIIVKFDDNPDLISRVKEIGARKAWNSSAKNWLFEIKSLEILKKALPEFAIFE